VTKFQEWCEAKTVDQTPHRLELLTAVADKLAQAAGLVGKAVPAYYVNPSRVAALLEKLGQSEAAEFVRQKLPTSKTIRSGDLAEILCTAYVHEATPFKRGIKRLRWKDHRNMSMRGEDVLAFDFTPKDGPMRILKAEVKSRAAMTAAVIGEAQDALSANNGLPSHHAMAFVAERLHETGDAELADALDALLLKRGMRAGQVTHLLFSFSGNAAENILKKSLGSYGGSISQTYIGLQVDKHQAFIADVFKAAGA
jgi:hypothetical protein